MKADGSISSSANDATRAYRLVSVTRRPESELKIFQTMAEPAGTVTLEVEGRALSSSGATTAVTSLRKVFKLVPKCCGTSFGGNHGNVNYARPASDSTPYVCLQDNMLGLGLVGGTGSTTGTFTLKGSNSISTEGGQVISTVYCLADTAGTCNNTVTGNQPTEIEVIDPRPSNFPIAKTYPGSTSSPAASTMGEPSGTNTAAFS